MEQSKITAIYCRTATPDATAIEAQRDTLLRFAAAQGFGDVEVFADDGCSGNDTARPAFVQMNALIAAGRIARVLARDVARLGRNIDEVLAWARTTQEQGAELVTLDMDFATLPERFAVWLATLETEPFAFREGGYHCTLLRVPKSPGFEYLYSQRHYHGSAIQRGENFEYAGIYCTGDGHLYDGQHDIRALEEALEGLVRGGARPMLKSLKAGVRAAVEATLGNDREKLRVKELASEKDIEDLGFFVRCSAASRARDLYISGADGVTYRCPYTPEYWTEASLLDYILDPEGFAASEAAAYIDGNQEAILYAFMQNSAVAAEYAALVGNPRHPAHRAKRIMEAMSATTAKTVRVTICKDDVDFTFKTEADGFRRDCVNRYWTHKIQAADRREFERLFGHSADYSPEDILRIEYGRTVLYEAQEVAA